MFEQFLVNAAKFFYLVNGSDVGCTTNPGFDYFLNKTASIIKPITAPNTTGQPYLLYQYACDCDGNQSGPALNLFQIGNFSNQLINANLTAVMQTMQMLCNQHNRKESEDVALVIEIIAGVTAATCALIMILTYMACQKQKHKQTQALASVNGPVTNYGAFAKRPALSRDYAKLQLLAEYEKEFYKP